jgi:hypothetical protein
VARRGRRRARRSLIAGGLLLVVGVVAVVVAVLEQQGNDDTSTVQDRAGIRYEVPNDWELGDAQKPLVVFERDGSRIVTITHGPDDDDRTAADQLADGLGQEVCEADLDAAPSLDGADDVAACRNASPGLPKQAVGAVAFGQFWVLTIEQAASDSEGDAFIDSVEFTTPQRADD